MTWSDVFAQAQDGDQIPACALCGGICAGCFRTEVCNHYQDVAPYDYALVMVRRGAGGVLHAV